MTSSGTERLVTLIALAAVLLAGCGGAGGRPRASTAPHASYATGGRAMKVQAEARRDADEEVAAAPAPADPGAAGGAVGRNELGAPAQAAKAPPSPPPSAGDKGPAPSNDTPRAEGTEERHDTSMLIYTAHVTMAVYQVEQGLAAVEKIARDNGGYLAQKRDKEITIRVPRGRFDPALAQVDKIGDVIHRDVQAQDVTDEYVDVEIRIKNARAMQARLKVLLEKASVKEALEIEKEMRRVTEELELLEGKLKLLKDKIAYSTITVTFEPRGSTIQATRIKLPFPWLTQLGLPTLLQLSEDR